MNKNQMNGLYPIIRRVRRPLLPVDWPTDAKPAVDPQEPAANREVPGSPKTARKGKDREINESE
jgi:hypothetical protein